MDKPPGLLTIGTEKEQSRTAYFMLTDYVRKGCSRSKKRLFIVHRLDRDTSGILIFAKSPEAKQHLQGQWEETKKKYLAVVHGKCEKSSETISTYLAENAAHRVYSTSDTTRGKTVSYCLQGTQTDKRSRFAGSRSVDGQEAPDTGASRGHRTPGCGRPKIWQRRRSAQAPGASCEVDYLHTPVQRKADHV